MRIIGRQEWGARYGDGKHWRDLPATEAWLHHSVTVAPDMVPPWTDDYEAIRAIEQIGRDRFGYTYGFPYTFGVTPAGRIYAGHHVGKTGAHTAGHNRVGIGICLVGNYEEDDPTDAQLDAVAWLLNEAHRQGWLAQPRLTGGHRDTKSTACPGRHAYAQISEINRRAEEDDMPSAKEIVDELLSRDAIETPWGNPENPTWTVKNALESMWVHTYNGWGDVVPAREEKDGTNWRWLGKNALGTTVKQGREILARQAALTEAVAALSSDGDLTADRVEQIVRDAVAQHIEITGEIEIGPSKEQS